MFTRRAIFPVCLISFASTSAVPTFAQYAQPGRPAGVDRPIATGGGQSLPPQAVMGYSGGSLLQASLPAATAAADNSGAGGAAPGGASGYSLYAVPEPTPKVLKKHDLVNIVVQETSTATHSGTTDVEKDANLDAKVDQFVKLNLASFSLHGTGQATNPVEAKISGVRGFKGDAAVNRSDTVTLRIEAEVLDVKPNGTLVLQARKHIKSDEEEQTFILTGTCRVQDVDATNSVLSTDLSDLMLQKQTKGVVRDNTSRGVIPRIFDFVNPF